MIPQTSGQFEIHVFDKSGREVGRYGPNEWFDKHGHKGKPANCPPAVENQLKGQSIDLLRSSNVLPQKGWMNIKGDRWITERGTWADGGGPIGNVRLNPMRTPYN